MSPILHFESDAIASRLHRERINALYHFTSVDNLPSIAQRQALLSKEALEIEMLWPPPVPGGNELSHNLDRQNDNWDKVSLNLTPFTPMVYNKKRQQHLCFFIVSPEVATWQGVVFTNTNAASTTNQRRGEGLKGLNHINFEAIRSKPQPWNRDGWIRPVQAEVLVPESIPLTYVSEIAFVSKASLNHAERLWGQLPYPPLSVN